MEDESKIGKMVGIDLGTTNSVIACLDELSKSFRILENKENEQRTRSIVNFYKGERLVGTPALNRWTLAPKDTIISIKRLMGRAISDPEVAKVKKWALYDIIKPSDGTKDSVCVKLGGEEYSPVDISAMILRKLKEDAEFRLKEQVTHAVITVPAYFSDKQRHATWEAGIKAGLTVMKILDEPTAAALAYGIDSGDGEGKIALVYDFGGGTFDISVLMMAAGTYQPLNLEGDMWLGGDNFDQMIIEHVVEYVKREYGIDPTDNLRFMVQLKLKAKEAKEILSAATKTDIIVQGVLRDSADNIVDIIVEITRKQFEEMMKPLVDRTVSIVKKAVENAGYTPDDIDYVIMAGNSTCVPMVQQSMEELYGKEKVLRKEHPKNCVAIGAAMAAVSLTCIICRNCGHKNTLDAKKCAKCKEEISPTTLGTVAPFHYGIQTESDRFNVFIKPGEEFPTPEDKRKFQTFQTLFPNHRLISMPVYGGDHLESASDNEKQGEAFAILPPNCPKGTEVLIKLWLNKDGFFEIAARLADGADLKPWILRGESDQMVKETLESCLEKIANKKDSLSAEEEKKTERLSNDVFDKLQAQKFDQAEEAVKKLSDYIDKVGKEGEPLPVQAERMINFGTFIVREYDWLIGPTIHRLNNVMGDLQNAVDKNNHDLMEDKIKELEIEIEKLMQTKDASGEPQPTWLGVFMGMHGAIVSIIRPVDPARANSLREELNNVERVFKARQPDAERRINAFVKELNTAIVEAQKVRPEARKCPKCGYINPEGTRYCKKCKTDLWLLGTKT